MAISMSVPARRCSRQPAWGISRGPRRSSTSTTKTNRRRKFSNKGAISPSEGGGLHRLRSTPSSARQSNSASFSCSVSETSSSKGARTNHNQVEKQYRNRLNSQFKTLLQSLPRGEGLSSADKGVSKAEVLVLARKHIEELEREKTVLAEENQELQGGVIELKGMWVGLGGICMP
jgi:hypothetical protein